MRRSSLLSVCLALALSSTDLHPAACVQAAVADRRTFGAVNCRSETPAAWNAGHILWRGACRGGYADGWGVLRRTAQGTSELFLGRLEQGTLRSGVLNVGQGYTAGMWEAGALAESTNNDQANRNNLIAAFEDGAKAADATAKYMARHSDSKASRFYSRLAARLRSQMD